jgi:hypothetical protein
VKYLEKNTITYTFVSCGKSFNRKTTKKIHFLAKHVAIIDSQLGQTGGYHAAYVIFQNIYYFVL